MSSKTKPTTKQELLKLSKPQLIKMCKKKKLAVIGSKSDMIERILSFKNTNKAKSTSKSSKRKSKKSTHKTIIQHTASNIFNASKIDILVSGYINQYLYTNIDYADSLIIMFLQYIGNMFLKFDICPTDYIRDILQNGTVIKRDIHGFDISERDWDYAPLKYHCQYIPHKINAPPKWKEFASTKIFALDPIIYASSFAMNYNIHKWSIKIKNNKILDRIGIISDINLCKNKCRMMDIGCDAYYIYPMQNMYAICSKLWNKDKVKKKYIDCVYVLDDDTVYDEGDYPGDCCDDHDDENYYKPKSTGYKPVVSDAFENKIAALSDFGVRCNKIRKQLHDGWEKNDIVSVILDCNEWKLTFIVNDKLIGKPINIKNKCSYYAAIGSITNSVKFVLV